MEKLAGCLSAAQKKYFHRMADKGAINKGTFKSFENTAEGKKTAEIKKYAEVFNAAFMSKIAKVAPGLLSSGWQAVKTPFVEMARIPKTFKAIRKALGRTNRLPGDFTDRGLEAGVKRLGDAVAGGALTIGGASRAKKLYDESKSEKTAEELKKNEEMVSGPLTNPDAANPTEKKSLEMATTCGSKKQDTVEQLPEKVAMFQRLFKMAFLNALRK